MIGLFRTIDPINTRLPHRTIWYSRVPGGDGVRGSQENQFCHCCTRPFLGMTLSYSYFSTECNSTGVTTSPGQPQSSIEAAPADTDLGPIGNCIDQHLPQGQLGAWCYQRDADVQHRRARKDQRRELKNAMRQDAKDRQLYGCLPGRLPKPERYR